MIKGRFTLQRYVSPERSLWVPMGSAGLRFAQMGHDERHLAHGQPLLRPAVTGRFQLGHQGPAAMHPAHQPVGGYRLRRFGEIQSRQAAFGEGDDSKHDDN